MNDITDLEIDGLLVTLDKLAKANSPRYGLPIYGQFNDRVLFREAVKIWVAAMQPETLR